MEFALLELLMNRKGEPVSRLDLLETSGDIDLSAPQIAAWLMFTSHDYAASWKKTQ